MQKWIIATILGCTETATKMILCNVDTDRYSRSLTLCTQVYIPFAVSISRIIILECQMNVREGGGGVLIMWARNFPDI